MKISVIDKGSGVMAQFAQAIGTSFSGRFIYIPEDKGSGYITGFGWGNDLKMIIRNYYLKEDVLIERTNLLADSEENVGFFLSGIFPSPANPESPLVPEKASILICMQTVSSVIDMPSNTYFGSIGIVVSRAYLRQYFGNIEHTVVKTILEAKDNFLFETGISPEIIKTANEMLQQPIPESFESYYYKLKCEELLCYIFALLAARDAVPINNMHIDDIKAVYAVKSHLQSNLSEPPNIALLAREAHMSEPKLRKLFKQTFDKGVFEYYQSARMQEAAQLLKEKRLTVSETGYQLGFTNLSHFSRVFEQYKGMKPKKYQSQL